MPAAYVVRAPDGCEWFECVECVKLDREHGTDFERVTVVGIYEWFRARGLLYPDDRLQVPEGWLWARPRT